MGRPTSPENGDLVVVRSFVVRALLERNGEAGPSWHGFITDAHTSERRSWQHASEVAEFIGQRLMPASALGGAVRRVEWQGVGMAGPVLTDVVTEMLAVLQDRIPPQPPIPPDPGVTLERFTEKLVGLGNQRGTEQTPVLGTRTLRGGRLDARVRFQLWGDAPEVVDEAIRTVHVNLLDDREELRGLGFLRLSAVDTTIAEHVAVLSRWRKTTSFDVLYEYQYVDTDDADSLISQIPITTDPERADSPAREQQTVVDELVRWDSEAAPELVVTGPARVHRITALVFVPGPPLGGTVTLLRATGPVPGPVTTLPTLAHFLIDTGGSQPVETNAAVTLPPAVLFSQLGPAGAGLELGDWDADGAVDQYTGFDRVLDPPIELPTWADRLIVRYTPPPGPATGLDQTAVVYLRVNSP